MFNEEHISYSPVIVFVYNRPSHTKRTLETLNNLPESEYIDLFIFSDAQKNEKALDNVNKVREYIYEFQKQVSRFKKTTIISSEHNKGLAKSIIEGVTEIINKYGSVIVVEDDLIVSKDFLRYMNGALSYYKNNDLIWAISGYTFKMKALDNLKSDVYFSMRACSWGWATWVNRWNSIDWDMKDYKTIKYDPVKRIRFAKWGRDLPYMLDACYYKKINSWAIRWCYNAFMQNKYTVYPKESRVMSIGTDGSGTNFKSVTHTYETVLYTGKDDCLFVEPFVDANLRKEFRTRYMTISQKLHSMVKWTYYKMFHSDIQ